MTLSIIYKQQYEIFNIGFNQSNSSSPLNNDECRILFQSLVNKFHIEYNRSDTILLEYPNAKLRELLNDNNEDEDLVILTLNTDGYFSCKANRKYELYPGKHVPVKIVPDKEKCHFSNEDIQIAAILSDAVYYSDPIARINEKYSSYDCISTLTAPECGLKFASNAFSPYLLAISNNNVNDQTIWIAFRGTTNIDDVLTDLSIHPILWSSGMVHKGFAKRASDFPYDTLINEFNSSSEYSKRLIFTGHSLGGSVAHLCAIFNLANRSYKDKPQIYSIAFGSPFIGNNTVAKSLIKNNFNKHFLTIINENDIVPNLLNLVETGTRLQSTIEPIIKPCSEIANTLLPIISLATGVPQTVIKSSVEILNSLIPTVKKLLVNTTIEYRPIGQYGFIRSLLPSNNSTNEELVEWIITYKSNVMKINESNEEKFDDSISKKLIESFGPSTARITDKNIIDHYMERYITSLISCEIFRPRCSTSVRKNSQLVTELQSFTPNIREATAICSNTDIKITILGDQLDFVSLHKKMCIITSENFFASDPVLIGLEVSRSKLVLMSRNLVPFEKRLTIGPRQYKLDTHFGEINLNLKLYNDDSIDGQQIISAFQVFDVNFLMATFLRSFFEYVHSNNHLVLSNTKNNLYYFEKLFENRLQSKSSIFKTLLQKHLNTCQEMKRMNKPISIDAKLYNDMSGLINELYKALTEEPKYNYDKAFLQGVKENPKTFLFFGTCALLGTCALSHVALLSFFSYQLLTGTVGTFLATELTGGVLFSTGYTTLLSYAVVATIGHNLLERLIYHEHLSLLLNSIGGNSDECANERMLEIQIYDILEKKSIDFDIIDMTNSKMIEKTIKDKNLFNPDQKTRSERATLFGTTMESQIKAFKVLHDIYYICTLRRSMSTNYISFIGAHRAGKSSLLNSLWNIPAQRGDYLDNRTQQMQMYTLYDDENSNNKVHLIDYPGVTDPVETVAHLNQNYSVLSTFYVIVVRAGTDYNSAAKLIKELQASSSSSITTLPSKLEQPVSHASAHSQSKSVNEKSPIDQSNKEYEQYGLNKLAKFVVIITGIDTMPDSLIENELNEAINRRLGISKDLICLCYNKEAIDDENYRCLHASRNLPGISEARAFLNKHFNQIIDKDSDFSTYKYREQ